MNLSEKIYPKNTTQSCACTVISDIYFCSEGDETIIFVLHINVVTLKQTFQVFVETMTQQSYFVL